MSNPTPIHLYQIAYSQQSLAGVEPGYLVLDNLDNPRPDWYEYWPMRRFLLNEALDDNAFYGMFSTKFGSKTSMSHAQVVEFIRAHEASADVFLFSPQPDMGAFFLNVFEQGETFDPGFIDAFSAFLQARGLPVQLRSLVMDSRKIVFSNYFVAKPAFWREWLKLTEPFFEICEGPDSPLRQALTAATTYNEQGASRKVFLLERMASLLLLLQPRWRTKAADPYTFGWSGTPLNQHPMQAIISDALKLAFKEQGFAEYMAAYSEIRTLYISGRKTA